MVSTGVTACHLFQGFPADYLARRPLTGGCFSAVLGGRPAIGRPPIVALASARRPLVCRTWQAAKSNRENKGGRGPKGGQQSHPASRAVPQRLKAGRGGPHL